MITEEVIERLTRIKSLEAKYKAKEYKNTGKYEAKIITLYCNKNSNEGMITEETADYFSRVSDRISRYRNLIIILDSIGGSISAAWRIAVNIHRREGSVTVIVPEKAKSAATLIALAARQIIMLENAELGPLDPQIRYMEQFVSALDLLNNPDPVIKSKAQRIINQMKEYVRALVKDKYENTNKIDKLADHLLLLNEAHASHTSSIFYGEAKNLGFPAKAEMDLDVRALHQLYKECNFCEHDPSIIIEFFPF